jgi:hypothetical protein
LKAKGLDQLVADLFQSSRNFPSVIMHAIAFWESRQRTTRRSSMRGRRRAGGQRVSLSAPDKYRGALPIAPPYYVDLEAGLFWSNRVQSSR